MSEMTFDELNAQTKKLSNEALKLENKIVHSTNQTYRWYLLDDLFEKHAELVRSIDALNELTKPKKTKFEILKELFKR